MRGVHRRTGQQDDEALANVRQRRRLFPGSLRAHGKRGGLRGDSGAFVHPLGECLDVFGSEALGLDAPGVGKAPIGKEPVGKAPIGKAPAPIVSKY